MLRSNLMAQYREELVPIQRVTPVYRQGNDLFILDQSLLPGKVVFQHVKSVDELAMYIRTLAVRGAPAIGIAGAYGVFLAVQNADSLQAACQDGEAAVATLGATRPTAVNLRWALRRMWKRMQAVLTSLESSNLPDAEKLALLRNALRDEADSILEEDRRLGLAIGRNGCSLLRDGMSVLTHCNAGAIATGGYGTALAPIYIAHEQGYRLHIFADETRPLLQGMRLTAWELMTAGIDVTVICDNMAPFLMQQHRIDMVIVGADRIAANGDTANKIGTYGLALCAKAHGIPFYIAAPYSTFDPKLCCGAEIPIEQRDPAEVTALNGQALAPAGVKVYNPAFDITPGELITGIITEEGILKPPYHQSIATYLTGKSAGDQY